MSHTVSVSNVPGGTVYLGRRAGLSKKFFAPRPVAEDGGRGETETGRHARRFMRMVKRIMIVEISGNPFVGFAVFMRMTMLVGDCREGTVARCLGLRHFRNMMGVATPPDGCDCLEDHHWDDDKTKLLLSDQNLVLWLGNVDYGFEPIPLSGGEWVNKI